jgi:hypothetical protein
MAGPGLDTIVEAAGWILLRLAWAFAKATAH